MIDVKNVLKEWQISVKKSFSSDGERRTRKFKELMSALFQNLAALEEDPDTGEKHITKDTIKTWVNYFCGLFISFLSGIFSYWYVGGKIEHFKQDMYLYRLGSIASPPSSLWLIVTVLWCGIVALAVSLVAMGVVWLVMDVFVIRELTYKEDVRMTGIAMGCMIYVLIILLFCLIGVSVPAAYV